MFLICFILNLLLSPVSAADLVPFEQVSKNADNIISRIDQGEAVDPKETETVCLQLIDHVIDNLGKKAVIRQDSNLFVSEEDREFSTVLDNVSLRIIETREYRTFNQSFAYLKKMPLEFWGENLLAKLDAKVYNENNKHDSELAFSAFNISVMNVVFELGEYNSNRTLPKYFLDFFGHYYYNQEGMKLSGIIADDDIAMTHERADLYGKGFRNLLCEIASSYARSVLLEGFANNGCVNNDINNFGKEVDYKKYFGDIVSAEVTRTPSKIALMETINESSGSIYFNFDVVEQEDAPITSKFAQKMAEMKKFNASTTKFNMLEKLNEYLPKDLQADNMEKALDNFAKHIVNSLDGELGDKEDRLLFGDYTQAGRTGGLFDRIKMSNDVAMVGLIGVLAYANDLCESRDVNSSVYSGFKIVGIVQGINSINRDKLDPKYIQKRLQLKFSPKMMDLYVKGAELIRM